MYDDALNEVIYLGKYSVAGSGLKLDATGQETLLANRYVRLAPSQYRQDIVRSLDGGVTWVAVEAPAEIASTFQEIWRLAYGADGAVYAYSHDTAGLNEHRMYKSGDAGTSWVRVETLPPDTVDPGLYGLAMMPRTGEIPGIQRP